MRTLATIGAVSAAILLAASSAFAWTAEQPSKQDANNAAAANAVDLSDNDAFQALQDKVNGKTQSQSGFQIVGGTGASGSAAGLTGSNPYGVPSLNGGSAFSYSPNPGFRGGAN
jgi:hypothetical protein